MASKPIHKMGYLTTHVLDTANGRPGQQIKIEIYRIEAHTAIFLGNFTTNNDGRTDEPIIKDQEFEKGKYRLVFYVGDYFRHLDSSLSEFTFLDDIIINFVITDAREHYHVPLLVSPYSYSTYRGS